MRSRRDILTTGAAVGGVLLFGTRATAAAVRSATAITEVFGDGQKLTAIALEYDRSIDGTKLSPAHFRVEGRTITGVYAASAPGPAARARTGRYVIVALSPDDAAATLRIPSPPGSGNGPPRPGAPPPTLGAGGPKGPMFRPAKAAVTQIGPLTTAGGTIAPPPAPIATTAARNLIVDDFRQFEFRDPATGDVLKYNLFLPKGYEKGRTYPLVLFMHDASEIGADTVATLQQGLGAVIWASPAEQAKHPCFVLAPAYPTPMFIQSTYATSLLDTTIHLIEDLTSRYPIDPARLYTTGQSAGAMMSLAMEIKYPDLFAAMYIVAGQWDPALVKPLAKQKQWIVVAEGDEKAFPTQNAMTAIYEQEGIKVARATWDGRATPAAFATAVAAMEAERAPINYAVLRKGTVVPEGQRDTGGSNHVNTWRIAYTIEGIRDWLFRQRR